MGGDLCLHDESCTRQGDCEDHSCDPEEEEEDFDRLLVEVNAAMELIPAASSAEIRHFVSANADAVAFNRARQAIQFFRCEGGSKILAQVPLPAVVARDLARALDSDR